jgi:1-deoxy-D-xylulose-5-phosphate synthase
MRFVKPLDREAILSVAGSHTQIVTVEENAIAGGAGSGVNELLATEGLPLDILNIGLGDDYIQHATREQCLHQAGLDSEGIAARIIRRFGAVDQNPFDLESSGTSG